MQPASLARRMAAFVYEGVILFGVVTMAAYLYGALTQQRNALQGRAGLQGFVFIVLAIYFVWFWSHGGQTVAMKTWRVRVTRAGGGNVSEARALCRYLLAWLWLLPPLAMAYAGKANNPAAVAVLVVGWIAVYALASRLLPRRQFLHDVVCATTVVDMGPGLITSS